MSTDHKNQVETILQELGRKIDELISEAKDAKDEIRDDLEDKIEELKTKKDKLEDDYHEFKQNNEGKWVEIKTHLSSAADEIKLAAEAIFKKK